MKNKDKSLRPQILQVSRQGGTEPPQSGLYNAHNSSGSYLCRCCGMALYRSQSKFNASCGWPSFDEAIPKRVLTLTDKDGIRTEIRCANCQAHLGHVFEHEGFTPKNKRFCVNSISLDFVPDGQVTQTEEAIVAGGCFWGVDYYLRRLAGVLLTEVGYTGGFTTNPTYSQVCTGTTGHYEALRIVYNPDVVSYEMLLKYFFEIHSPYQANGQGPDLGQQYQSAVFYYDEQQKKTAESLIQRLQKSGQVATKCLPVSTFWPAEEDHQAYYEKTGHLPYCHTYVKRF